MASLAKSLIALSLALSLSLPAAAQDGRYGSRAPVTAQSAQSDPNRELDSLAQDLSALRSLALQVRDYELRSRMYRRIEQAEASLLRAQRGFRMEDRQDRRQESMQNKVSYADMKSMLDGKHFDHDRIAIIERVAPSARLTTSEVTALVRMFDWDTDKKRALVALFPATIDQGRFVLALDALDWDSSRRDVAQQLGI